MSYRRCNFLRNVYCLCVLRMLKVPKIALITSGRYGRLWMWSLFKDSVTTYTVGRQDRKFRALIQNHSFTVNYCLSELKRGTSQKVSFVEHSVSSLRRWENYLCLLVKLLVLLALVSGNRSGTDQITKTNTSSGTDQMTNCSVEKRPQEHFHLQT